MRTSGIEVLGAKSAELILALIFVCSSFWKSYSDASGLPIQMNEKCLNVMLQPYLSKVVSKASRESFVAGPFDHVSGDLKAYVTSFKVSDIDMPQSISVGVVPKEGLELTSHNVSFKVEGHWENARVEEIEIEDGNIKADVGQVEVSFKLQVTIKEGMPSLEPTGCRASIGSFNFRSGDMFAFYLRKKHMIEDLKRIICEKALDIMTVEMKILNKRIRTINVLNEFRLSNIEYETNAVSAVLTSYLWPGKDKNFQYKEMTGGSMFTGIITEDLINSWLVFSQNKIEEEFLIEVNLHEGAGPGWTHNDQVTMRLQFPNAPKTTIDSKGIRTITTGAATFIPCQGKVDSKMWTSTKFNVTIYVEVALGPSNRSLTVALEKILVSTPHYDEASHQLVEVLIDGYLRSQGQLTAEVEVPLPYGMASDGLEVIYKDGLLVVSSNFVNQEVEEKKNQ